MLLKNKIQSISLFLCTSFILGGSCTDETGMEWEGRQWYTSYHPYYGEQLYLCR